MTHRSGVQIPSSLGWLTALKELQLSCIPAEQQEEEEEHEEDELEEGDGEVAMAAAVAAAVAAAEAGLLRPLPEGLLGCLTGIMDVC